MKNSQKIKLAQIVLISFILASQISSHIICNEHLTTADLQTRVKAFNQWYSGISPNAKLEAKLTDDNKIKAYALEDIKVTLSLIIRRTNRIFLYLLSIQSARRIFMILKLETI